MKKIVAIAVGLIVLALGGLLLNKYLADKNEKEQKAALLIQLKKQVTQDLKDPTSAQFRNVRYRVAAPDKAEAKFTHFLCGEINSKNSYGAFVGFKSFVSAFKTTASIGSKDVSAEFHMIDPAGNSNGDSQEAFKNLELLVLFIESKRLCPAETEPIVE